jgi:5-methylthioadenosine/S-adenosylhomocysteine deaminase
MTNPTPTPDLHTAELTHGTRRPVLLTGAVVISGDPVLGDFPLGDVLLRGGTIEAVDTDLAAQAGPDAIVVDARGTIAIPGFVDSHVHAWEGQLRAFGPQADFAAYLGITAFGYGPRFRPEDAYAGTLATALTALDAGITTIVDNAHNALTPDHVRAGVQAVRDTGLRTVHAVGSPFGSELQHVPSVVPALRDELAGDLVDLRLFEVNPSLEMWQFARKHDLWVSTELGTHTPALEEVIEDLHRNGLLGAKHAFNHAYDLTDRTWDLIAESGAVVNVAPRSDAAFGLGSTVTPVDQALARGVTVGISGDNEISYGLSMFSEMQNLNSRYRSEMFRRRSIDESQPAPSLSPARLLSLATQGGAANAGLADRIGSLTPGKAADVVLVRTDAPNTFPATDPVATVTAYAHSGNVDTVFVGGRLRKRHGALVGIDAEATQDRIRRSRDALLTDASRV